nr:hypothetical protein [Tanacetum cinerariifolium]
MASLADKAILSGADNRPPMLEKDMYDSWRTPQIDYAPISHHPSKFSSPETGLVVPVFQKKDDPIDPINHMMSFLTSVVTSSAPNPRGSVMQNGSGTLPGNTVTNPKEDLKGITTRSGVAYQGPTILTPSTVAKQGTEIERNLNQSVLLKMSK